MPSTITRTKRWNAVKSYVPFHVPPAALQCCFLPRKSLSSCDTFMTVLFLVIGLKTLRLCMVWIDPVKNSLKTTIRMMYGLILVAIAFRVRLMTGETISHSLEMQGKVSVLQEKALWLKSHILKFTAPASGSALLRQRGETAWQGSADAAELWMRPLQNAVLVALREESSSSLLP